MALLNVSSAVARKVCLADVSFRTRYGLSLASPIVMSPVLFFYHLSSILHIVMLPLVGASGWRKVDEKSWDRGAPRCWKTKQTTLALLGGRFN